MNSTNSQLHNDPRIQAAAIAYLATDVKYTGDEGDADDFADRTAQAITDCCAAMGVVEDSPLGDVVGEAIRDMSDKMRLVLVNVGTLRSDCAEAWQAQVA
jgi:hypothetical protein